jgi:hypothetical protein
MNSPPKGELGSRFRESACHASLHGGPMVRSRVQTGRFKHMLAQVRQLVNRLWGAARLKYMEKTGRSSKPTGAAARKHVG